MRTPKLDRYLNGPSLLRGDAHEAITEMTGHVLDLRRRLARALSYMRTDQKGNCPGRTETFYCGCGICTGLAAERREIRARRRKESV